MRIDTAKLSSLQRENLVSALSAYHERNRISSSHPVALYIELTKNCIGRCRFCRKGWRNHPRYNMSKDLFETLLKEYVPYATFVDLRGFGESLMLSDFDWYVEKVSQVCPHIRLTTTLGCGSQRVLQSLVDHDVFISVSFDAADKPTFEAIRKGIRYDTVIKNMEFLSRQILRKHGRLDDRMRIAIAPLQAANLDYIEGIIDLAERLGITGIRILPLSAHAFNFNRLYYHKRKTMKKLLMAIRHAHKKGVSLQLGTSPFSELRFDDKVRDCCCKPWMYAAVNYEGKMLHCDCKLSLSDNTGFLGWIHESPETVWNGVSARLVRTSHANKHRLSDDCSRCYRQGRYCDHEQDIDHQFLRWLVTDKEMEEKISASSMI